jgi:Yip1 domain
MNVVDRAKNILLKPAREWEVIKNEPLTTGVMYNQYVMIMALIPAAAGFIGRSIIGYPSMGVVFKVPFFRGLAHASVYYLLTLVGVYLLARIIDALAPSFGARKDLNGSLKVAVFSMTASCVASIFMIIPALSMLSILGLYSLYLLYGGIKTIKEPPADKLTGYYVITLLITIGMYFIIGVITSVMTLGGGGTGVMRGW